MQRMVSPTLCIDCSPLLVRSAGVKTYLYYWANAMLALEPDSIRTFLAPGVMDRLFHQGGLVTYPLQLATLLVLNRLPTIFTSLGVPQCDIFHASNLLRRIPNRRRLSATIHDLTPWMLPECFTPTMVAADHAFAERVLKRADGLIAVSENTKRDAVRVLGLSPDRIRVIHLGIPSTYSSVEPQSVIRVMNSHSLTRPYYLFIGTIEPRKNVDTLLSAWEALPEQVRSERELIIAGMPGWRAGETLNRLEHLSRDPRAGIRYLGYVPEPDMPALTAGAEAFVYPSLYEGFGIPVAQAMAAGCPVITSNLSSLPEVTGGAALLVDPRSIAELSSAILRIAESQDLRADLKARGIERAKQFSWEIAARKSLDFFAEIA